MKKLLYNLFLTAILIPLLLIAGCSDELNVIPDYYEAEEEGIPVEFSIIMPDMPGSRAYIDGFGNERFSTNDMIHVLGTFQTHALQEDGTYLDGTLTRYGALRYDGINWKAVAGSQLTWPSIATEGTFTAYYISDSDGILTGSDPTQVSLLSELSTTTDPLMAESESAVAYGNAAELKFSHICAHLTLIDLEPIVSENYWFTCPDATLTNTDGTTQPFNNAFRISLGTGTYGPTLNFSFIQTPDPAYQNLVYINGKSTVIPPPETSPLDPETMQLEYFLEPGYYRIFQLVYPISTSATYSYLEYNYDNIPDYSGDVDYEKVPPQLEANTPYTLEITKSPGITITTPPTGGGWDESDDFYYIVDVEEFLKSAQQGSSYIEGDKEILEQTLNGSRLLCNVDFHSYDYSNFEDQSFLPDIPEHIVFDGGLHYIKNIAVPVFHYNYGTIQNVGIKNPEGVIINVISYEDNDPDKDNSRNGALCHQNMTTGTLNNIRLSDILMQVQIKSEVTPGSDDSEVHNVGSLAGSNTGVIEQVEMGGTCSIVVTGYPANSTAVNSTVLIGGVLGQNAGSGTVSEISTISNNLRINITNSCVGDIGDYAVGGIVGQLSGDVSGVFIPYVNIDCTQSIGVTSYIGGMAGNLTTTTETENGILSSCNVGGVVRAGQTRPYGQLTAGSYTGGIAGVVLNVGVSDCNSSVSVYGAATESQNVIYASGGAFGRIRPADAYTIDNLICYGSALTGPSQYIGLFAGIAPTDDTWNSWLESIAQKNITVNTNFNGIAFIGTSM